MKKFYVVFASAMHDIFCVEVRANDASEAKDRFLTGYGSWVPCIVFDVSPLDVAPINLGDL